MRKLLASVLFCFAVAALATLRSVSADDSMSNSTAAMPKSHQYLIGEWNCTVNLAAMEGQPATTDHGAMTISTSPSMTLHSHVAAKDYMSDSYQGYDAKTKTHWLNTTDTMGLVTMETSKDGMVFAGTTWEGGHGIPTRDTQTKISDTKIRDVTELQQNGKWTQIADTVCTK
jgi:hypothetical protein